MKMRLNSGITSTFLRDLTEYKYSSPPARQARRLPHNPVLWRRCGTRWGGRYAADAPATSRKAHRNTVNFEAGRTLPVRNRTHSRIYRTWHWRRRR